MTNRLINQNPFLSTAPSSLLGQHEVLRREHNAAAAAGGVSQRLQIMCSLGLARKTTFSGGQSGVEVWVGGRSMRRECPEQDKCPSGHRHDLPVYYQGEDGFSEINPVLKRVRFVATFRSKFL